MVGLSSYWLWILFQGVDGASVSMLLNSASASLVSLVLLFLGVNRMDGVESMCLIVPLVLRGFQVTKLGRLQFVQISVFLPDFVLVIHEW